MEAQEYASEAKKSAAQLPALGRLELANGHYLEFYEPVAGVLMAGELGRAQTTTLRDVVGEELKDLRPSDYYVALGRDREIPRKILDAEARLGPRSDAEVARSATARKRFARGSAQLTSPQLTKAAGGSCPSEWFQEQFCGRSATTDIDWCQLNLTTDAWQTGSEMQDFQATACPDVGSVYHTVRAGNKQSSRTLSAGQYYTFWFWCTSAFLDDCSEFDFESRTFPSSDTQYHHGGWGRYD
jgi:hypothetical protein